jgi:hypothetical protein
VDVGLHTTATKSLITIANSRITNESDTIQTFNIQAKEVTAQKHFKFPSEKTSHAVKY